MGVTEKEVDNFSTAFVGFEGGNFFGVLTDWV